MRVLIVGDDGEAATALKTGLEAECYSVDVELDAAKGSYRARTHDYDLVILDNVCCGGQGHHGICSELRRYEMSVPILVVCDETAIEEKIGILNCGADDCMTRPCAFSELAARVRALLRRPRLLVPAELRIGDLVLNRAAFTVSRGVRQLELTAKEFALLEYLMRNEGRVVSRAMIFEHVWDDEADPFSNTVEAHIYRLRRQVDRGAKEKLIRTVPRRGYMIGDATRGGAQGFFAH